MVVYDTRRTSYGFAFECPVCGEIAERRDGRAITRVAERHYERHELGEG